MNLKENQKIKLDIRKQGINGEGIGYYNRMAIFVPGAIRKEFVQVEIEKVFDKYANARLLSILKPSKKRVKPDLQREDDCGHFQMQHIEYKEQLKNKQLIIEQTFKRFSSLEDVKSKVGYALHGELKYNYRDQMVFTFRNTNFGIDIGVYDPLKSQFVYVKECQSVNQEINQILALVLKLTRKHKLKAFDQRNKEGHLFDLFIRYFKDTDSASIVFVVNEVLPKLTAVADELVQTFQSIQSVGYSLFNSDSRILFYNPVVILSGVDKLKTHYHDYLIDVTPRGIYPDNSEVFELMDKAIIKETGVSTNDRLLNLYQYSTLSSLYFSAFVKHVTAIDYDESSIADAKDNAMHLGLKNVELIEEHVEAVLEDKLKKNYKVLNIYAPKHGLGFKVLGMIRNHAPEKIVYISDNLSSMAKDVDRLLSRYEVTKILPVDMFPHNATIYGMVFLDRL